MNDVRRKCVNVFARVMEVAPESINEDTNPGNLAQWDSLSHVQLIVELEKELSIEISPEEGIELESFKLVCDFASKKLS